MSERRSAAGSFDRERLAWFVGVVARPQSYRNVLYLLLAGVLGYLYVVLFVLALVGGVFAIFGVGVVVLFGALVGSRLFARVERRLANALLGTDIERPPPVETGDGAWRTAVAYATDHATWRGLAFLSLKFWLGLVSFVFVFAGGVIVLALLVPVGEAEVLGWTIDSTAESLLAMPVGVLSLFLFFHLCNAAATLSGAAATALLGGAADGRGRAGTTGAGQTPPSDPDPASHAHGSDTPAPSETGRSSRGSASE